MQYFCLLGIFWALWGLENLSQFIRDEGWPDCDTYDGPEIDFAKSAQLIIAFVALGPLLYILARWLNKKQQ